MASTGRSDSRRLTEVDRGTTSSPTDPRGETPMRSRSPTRHRAAPAIHLIVFALACSSRAPVAGSSRAPATPIAEPPRAASPFGPTVANLRPPPGPAPAGMVWIPGGEFSMGGEETLPDARPVHRVYVDGFWMNRTEVTNGEFARF